MPEYPITLWQSTLGAGDGQDMATRGYLLSLIEVGYEHAVVLPRGGKFDHLDEPWLKPFEAVLGYPAKFQKEMKRVQEGDPRVGTRWKHLDDASLDIPVPAHAPPGTQPAKWDGLVHVGEVDQDYYNEHPEAARSEWTPHTELVVVHVDPGRLARTRDHIAMEAGGQTPIAGITAWEADRVPAAIAQQLSDLDCLIVPSEHTAAAFRRSGLEAECPVRVVPHALVMAPLAEEEYQKSTRSSSPKLRFYCVASDIPRKNLRGLIAAYCRAFSPTFQGVELGIKTNGDRRALEQLYREGCERAGTRAWPEISLWGGKWSDKQIRELHRRSNCFVSATRGEGFGLSEMEAAAMGNPVITTGWGAAPEVLGLPGVMLTKVGYDLAPVPEEMAKLGVYAPDQQWAEPRLDELADAMRTVAIERWSKSLAQSRRVAEEYSLRKVGHKLEAALRVAKDRVD